MKPIKSLLTLLLSLCSVSLSFAYNGAPSCDTDNIPDCKYPCSTDFRPVCRPVPPPACNPPCEPVCNAPCQPECTDECHPDCTSDCCCGLDFAHLWVGYGIGDYIGNDSDYYGAGIFVPCVLCNYLGYFNVNGYDFCGNSWALNVGFGVRLFECNRSFMGFNIYYDGFQSCLQRYYNRVGIGLEWSTCAFDLSVNVYVPFGEQVTFGKTEVFDNYCGGYKATCQVIEFTASRGIDAIIGGYISQCHCVDFYLSGGPYYYFQDHKERNIYGAELSLIVSMYEYISFEVCTSYDSVFKSQTEALISLTFPLELLCRGCSSCQCQTCFNPCMYQLPCRNDFIFTDTCCRYNWNW